MSILNPYDPFEIFKKFNGLWEKQMNDFISLWKKQSQLVNFSTKEPDSNNQILELFQKNQEALADILNLPKKSDLINLEKQNELALEKIESLEGQISSLQDSIKSTGKDIEGVVAVSKEMIKLTKQLKTELKKTKKELAERKELQADLQNMNHELARLNSFKEEMEIVKSLIDKGEKKEPSLSGPGQSK